MEKWQSGKVAEGREDESACRRQSQVVPIRVKWLIKNDSTRPTPFAFVTHTHAHAHPRASASTPRLLYLPDLAGAGKQLHRGKSRFRNAASFLHGRRFHLFPAVAYLEVRLPCQLVSHLGKQLRAFLFLFLFFAQAGIAYHDERANRSIHSWAESLSCIGPSKTGISRPSAEQSKSSDSKK